ncbi:hypothetical protein D3C87_1003800 [compost metagenome]
MAQLQRALRALRGPGQQHARCLGIGPLRIARGAAEPGARDTVNRPRLELFLEAAQRHSAPGVAGGGAPAAHLLSTDEAAGNQRRVGFPSGIGLGPLLREQCHARGGAVTAPHEPPPMLRRLVAPPHTRALHIEAAAQLRTGLPQGLVARSIGRCRHERARPIDQRLRRKRVERLRPHDDLRATMFGQRGLRRKLTRFEVVVRRPILRSKAALQQAIERAEHLPALHLGHRPALGVCQVEQLHGEHLAALQAGFGEKARKSIAVDVFRQLAHERVPACAIVERDEARTLLLQTDVRVLGHPARRLGQRRIDETGLQLDAHAARERHGIARLHDGHRARIGHCEQRRLPHGGGERRHHALHDLEGVSIAATFGADAPAQPLGAGRHSHWPQHLLRLAGPELHAALDLQAACGQRIGGHRLARTGPIAVHLDDGLRLQQHQER